MKTIAFLTLILTLSFATISFAQNTTEYKAKYRVTAVKNGEPDIVSVSNEVEVQPDIYVYIPNAFTPNGDGLNDSFGALGYGIQDYHMIIFNKWGELIFESSNVNDQWDGTFNGEKALPGTYIYSISAKGYYEKEFQQEGSISIVKI